MLGAVGFLGLGAEGVWHALNRGCDFCVDRHRIGRHFQIVGFEASDLVAEHRCGLELEVGGGVAHLSLELGDVMLERHPDEMIRRRACVDR